MKEIVKDKMIFLGHGKWIRSDVIIAVEPIMGRYYNTAVDGSKIRSRVLINHAQGEILASRTAETILKSMTVQEEATVPFGEAMLNIQKLAQKITTKKPCKDTRDEKGMIIDALVHWNTVTGAIESLPFGRSKFYKLVKKYGIDTRLYANYTDDPQPTESDGLV